MDKKVKIAIVILIIVMIIVAAIIIAYYVMNNKNQLENMSNNTTQNIINNEQQNILNQSEENTLNDAEVSGNTTNTDTHENSNIITGSEEELIEKAINIVKQDWGEDSTVYFDCAGIDNDGRYVISVHNKETTEVLQWYSVNTTTGQFFIQ